MASDGVTQRQLRWLAVAGPSELKRDVGKGWPSSEVAVAGGRRRTSGVGRVEPAPRVLFVGLLREREERQAGEV